MSAGQCLFLLELKVDNPIVMLTQETSKTFLSSKSDKDRFKVCGALVAGLTPVTARACMQFYMKGTQLELMDRRYSAAQKLLSEGQTSLSGSGQVSA